MEFSRVLFRSRSLARLLSQSRDAIARVVGRGSPIVPLLLASRDAMREAMRSELHDKRITASSRRLIDYLKISMGGLPDETLRVLFLDARQRLIADEQMQRGTIDQRSEEHTSELQSLMRISYAVFCLKKKTTNHRHTLSRPKTTNK